MFDHDITRQTLAERIADADALASRWLADGN